MVTTLPTGNGVFNNLELAASARKASQFLKPLAIAMLQSESPCLDLTVLGIVDFFFFIGFGDYIQLANVISIVT